MSVSGIFNEKIKVQSLVMTFINILKKIKIKVLI